MRGRNIHNRRGHLLKLEFPLSTGLTPKHSEYLPVHRYMPHACLLSCDILQGNQTRTYENTLHQEEISKETPFVHCIQRRMNIVIFYQFIY